RECVLRSALWKQQTDEEDATWASRRRLVLVSAVASTLAPSYWSLVIARFLGGLAFSSISLASMYIGEIAPPTLRGKLVSMTQINIVIGLSAAYFINYFILQLSGSDATWVQSWGLDTHTWRWMLGSEIFFALLWFFLLAIIPESPSWLVYNNREDAARNALAKLFPATAISQEISRIRDSLRHIQPNRSVSVQLRELVSKPMRRIFIVAATIAIAQQATGINAILFYAPTFFEQMGLGTDAAFAQALWIGLVSVIFTVLSIALIDRFGRRPMIIWGMVWIVLSLSLCAYGFYSARYVISPASFVDMQEIPNVERLHALADIEYTSDIAFKQALQEVLGEEDARAHLSLILQTSAHVNSTLILVAILSFIAAFHFSVGPIMWVLFSELFPISLRGIAIPAFALMSSLVNYVVQQFFPWQLTHMGGTSIFLSYAGVVFLGLIILYRFLPETKNLSIEEIQFKMGAGSRESSLPSN
ncbi:MAG: MFS transporter, partial [Bacteroidota bacterium]